MAALPTGLHGALADASNLVRLLLKDVFDRPVHAFEHGNATAGSKIVCTVEHAHLHFLPANVNVDAYLSRYQWTEVVGPLEVVTEGHEYLFYQTPSGSQWVTTGNGGSFPSQYLRLAFAEALGVANRWNWRENPASEVTRQTLESLRSRVFLPMEALGADRA
jgi:hypothetical protein